MVSGQSIGVSWRCSKKGRGWRSEWSMHDPTIIFLYYEVDIGLTDDSYQYVRLYLYYSCYVFFDIVLDERSVMFHYVKTKNSSSSFGSFFAWWELCSIIIY